MKINPIRSSSTQFAFDSDGTDRIGPEEPWRKPLYRQWRKHMREVRRDLHRRGYDV